jgi:hypothetical protein
LSSPSCGSQLQSTVKLEYLLTVQVFCDVTLCCWISVSQCFGGIKCLHHQGLKGSRILTVSTSLSFSIYILECSDWGNWQFEFDHACTTWGKIWVSHSGVAEESDLPDHTFLFVSRI